MSEQEKAEQQKRQEFYEPDVNWTEEEEDRGCDYDFGDECVEPHLRDMGNCFECWLFMEVDAEVRKQLKTMKKVKVKK